MQFALKEKGQMVDSLKKLGFKQTSDNSPYFKDYDGYRIEVCADGKKVNYGDSIEQGDKTTSNLEIAESLVVLECVDRLLSKGYRPQDLTLEKRWKLGRRAKGGKADICIKHKETDKNYLIIECKTWGSEYEKEKTRMIDDGGQLFSYYQQETDTEYLCLYSSRLDGDVFDITYEIVPIEEHYKYLGNVSEIVTRWNKQFRTKGIFDSDSHAYDIVLKEFKKRDLKQLKEEDGNTIYNQFDEVLRHNVVSDKGNAFNKLFNLFICKIWDEDKGTDQMLDFQWKEGEDTYKSFIGRLNSLYKDGMKRYLEKEITDHDPKDIEDKDIKRVIEELRLYKDQEFAFVEVFNKDSFEENAKIVREVVELLQGWQIRYTEKQQFLGDFFENLLNDGFKQESGQFFTPVPLVRFIIKCLPIKDLISMKISKREKNFLPYVIDFACGSGHFLTEAMDIIQDEVKSLDAKGANPSQANKIETYKRDTYEWAKEYVYGIEKDYRLVKTTKLACFLYGDGEAKILHASGLDPFGQGEFKGQLEKPEQFDVLIANPPFAVKGFKGTVKNGREFTLYNDLKDSSKEIELLFIERMGQLLKANGMAGIVLPRSILSNNSKVIYAKARRLLLEQFEIKAIAFPNDKAFMATATKTAIFFLRKRSAQLTLEQKEDYKKMAEGKQLVVVSNEGKNEDGGAFLGYGFSQRRGSEGIKLDTGMLVDEKNINNVEFANSYVLQAMRGDPIGNIAERFSENIYMMNLTDCFDWDTDKFENTLRAKKKLLIRSKYPPVKLRDVIESQTGLWESKKKSTISMPVLRNTEFLPYGSLEYEHASIIPISVDEYSKRKLMYDDILLELSGGSNKQNIARVCIYRKKDEEYSFGNFIMRIRSKDERLLQNYLFYFLMDYYYRGHTSQFQNGIRILNLDRKRYFNIDLPLPPLAFQQEIVGQLDNHQAVIEKASQTQESYKPQISIQPEWERVKLGEVITTFESGNRPKGGLPNIDAGAISLGGEHIHKDGYVVLKDRIPYVPLEFYRKSKQGFVEQGDILVCKDGALTGKTAYVDKEFPCKEVMANEHVYVIRANEIVTQKFLFYYLCQESTQKQIQELSVKSSIPGLNRKDALSIQIHLPPLDKQEEIVARLDNEQVALDSLQAQADVARQKMQEIMKKVYEVE